MAVNFWHWQKYLNGDFGCDFVWNDFSQYKKRHLVQFSRKVACSRRSDSGERCEVKKAMKSFASTPFYFAPLPSIGRPGTGYLERGDGSWLAAMGSLRDYSRKFCKRQARAVSGDISTSKGRYTRRVLLPEHAPGSFCTCQYTRGSVFKFAQFAPGPCSQIFNRLNIMEHFVGWKFCSRG